MAIFEIDDQMTDEEFNERYNSGTHRKPKRDGWLSPKNRDGWLPSINQDGWLSASE